MKIPDLGLNVFFCIGQGFHPVQHQSVQQHLYQQQQQQGNVQQHHYEQGGVHPGIFCFSLSRVYMLQFSGTKLGANYFINLRRAKRKGFKERDSTKGMWVWKDNIFIHTLLNVTFLYSLGLYFSPQM